jgi:hypothetical protein
VRIAQALGCTHTPPGAATLHTILRHVDRDEGAAPLGAWAERVVESLPTVPEAPATVVALEGNTRRGATHHGAPGLPRCSALAHHGGMPLVHPAVDDTTHAITAVETIVRPWGLEGRMVTMDALLTQRHVAQSLVDTGGDEVRIVQEHPPRLRAEIARVFSSTPRALPRRTATRGGQSSIKCQKPLCCGGPRGGVVTVTPVAALT